ncbi:MAG: hypothetical protein ACRDS0_09085 [Pseudonocardiaceae bacterium]
MIKEDRELLVELARLNSVLAPLAMCIMEGTASAAEQHTHGLRLIAAGMSDVVIEGEVLASGPLVLPLPTIEPHSES